MTAPASPMHPPAVTPWRLVILLGALTAFASMSIDMYLPSLPALQASLGATATQAQMSVGAFFAGMAVGQLMYGPASDRFGRRPPILVGASIYVVASIACALSTSPEMLIAARFVQAIGGCAGGVVARAVVRDRFNHQDTARVLSLLTLIMGLAPILAPLAGSAILAVAGWRAIFGVLVAFGVIVGLWTLFDLKESRSAETAAFARNEHPLRGLAVLARNRRLVGYALAGALNGAMLFTYIAVSPDLMIGAYKITPGNFGWLFGLNAVAVIGASQINRFLLRRHLADSILARASLIAVAAAVILAVFAFTGVGGKYTVLPAMFLLLGSYGFMQGNTMAGALSVDPLRAGSVSALMGTASFGMGALASTVTGLFHDGTPRPLAAAALIAMCGSALSLHVLTLRKTRGDRS